MHISYRVPGASRRSCCWASTLSSASPTRSTAVPCTARRAPWPHDAAPVRSPAQPPFEPRAPFDALTTPRLAVRSVMAHSLRPSAASPARLSWRLDVRFTPTSTTLRVARAEGAQHIAVSERHTV
eukprot:7175537-Prymnesium_polylepis.1